jgi:hypothetical protein
MSVFTEERRLGLHQIPEQTVLIAAGNPSGSDYFGNELDKAQVERFTHVSYAPGRNESLDFFGNVAGEHPQMLGMLGYFEQVADAIQAPMLPLPYKPAAVPRAIEAAFEWVGEMRADEFSGLGIEILEGLLGEHTHGVIQAINNAFEKPVPVEDLFSGRGLATIESWTGAHSKMGLLNATLRGFCKAAEGPNATWKDWAGRFKKKPELMEKLAEVLVKFPIDSLRKFIKDLVTTIPASRELITAMVTFGSQPTYPWCGAWLVEMRKLKENESLLLKELASSGKGSEA